MTQQLFCTFLNGWGERNQRIVFFGHVCSIQKSPGQGPNLTQSSNPSHSNNNAESLTTRPPRNSKKTFYNLSCEISNIFIIISNKDTTRKVNYWVVSLMNISSDILYKILANQTQQPVKGLYTMVKWKAR